MTISKRRITLIRRITQIAFFIFLVYGGALGLSKQETSSLAVAQPSFAEATTFDEVFVGPSYNQPFDNYLPVQTCRFVRSTGMFTGCFFYSLLDIAPYFIPLENILPILFLFLVLAILLGRFLCGWICPMGFIEDILTIIRKYLGFAYITLSQGINNLLRKTGYVVLISALALSVIIAFPCLPWNIRKGFYLAGCQMCPSRFICPLLTGFPLPLDIMSPIPAVLFVIGIVFLLIFLLSSVIKRFWCRICPSGLMLSFFNRGALLTIEKDVSRCTQCGTCAVGCPVDSTKVYEEKQHKVVNHSRCISCFRCVDLCPEEKCLQVKFLGLRIFKSS